MAGFHLVLADRSGGLVENKYRALARSGNDLVPLGALIPMPRGAQLMQMPDRHAVTRDRNGGRTSLPDSFVPVAAVLPIGYTRTLLPPAFGGADQTPLPLFGYTAVAERNGDLFVAAMRTEDAGTWDMRRFNTTDLAFRVARKLEELPENVVVQQLARCATEYGCFTAQNTFYERWEMALPTSVACNARCIGCLSEQDEHSCPASQLRITRRASVDDVVALSVPHLERHARPMVSFGQGCEGEPLLNWRIIEEAILRIRRATPRGWINVNTNGSNPEALSRLIDAGLDSVRISTISAREATYMAYYRPRNYRFSDVVRSLKIAAQRHVRSAVNLLVFPGITDRASEADALTELFATSDLEQVQLRNLNIDPDQLMRALPLDSSETMGIGAFVERLRHDIPALQIGSVSRLPDEDRPRPWAPSDAEALSIR